jgi:hypothetical protein
MQRDHAGSPMAENLRELAAWYREFAERAESTVIWEARLRMAEDLEREADRLHVESQPYRELARRDQHIVRPQAVHPAFTKSSGLSRR